MTGSQAGVDSQLAQRQVGLLGLLFKALHAAWLLARHCVLHAPPQVGSTWHRPQVAEPTVLLHTSPAGQPPPQVVSQEHWPQVGELGLELHSRPAPHELPPQVVSHTQ